MKIDDIIKQKHNSAIILGKIVSINKHKFEIRIKVLKSLDNIWLNEIVPFPSNHIQNWYKVVPKYEAVLELL